MRVKITVNNQDDGTGIVELSREYLWQDGKYAESAVNNLMDSVEEAINND